MKNQGARSFLAGHFLKIRMHVFFFEYDVALVKINEFLLVCFPLA